MSVYLWHTECQSMRQDLFTPSTAIKTLISTPTITLSKPPDVVPIYIIGMVHVGIILHQSVCFYYSSVYHANDGTCSCNLLFYHFYCHEMQR